MLKRKEMEKIFRKYLATPPFGGSEIAQIEAYRVAEEGYTRLSRQLCDKFEGEKRELADDMLSYQEVMEMYHNIYYLWKGYLWGRESKKFP